MHLICYHTKRDEVKPQWKQEDVEVQTVQCIERLSAVQCQAHSTEKTATISGHIGWDTERAASHVQLCIIGLLGPWSLGIILSLYGNYDSSSCAGHFGLILDNLAPWSRMFLVHIKISWHGHWCCKLWSLLCVRTWTWTLVHKWWKYDRNCFSVGATMGRPRNVSVYERRTSALVVEDQCIVMLYNILIVCSDTVLL